MEMGADWLYYGAGGVSIGACTGACGRRHIGLGCGINFYCWDPGACSFCRVAECPERDAAVAWFLAAGGYLAPSRWIRCASSGMG